VEKEEKRGLAFLKKKEEKYSHFVFRPSKHKKNAQ
jgi:hypothetical protein